MECFTCTSRAKVKECQGAKERKAMQPCQYVVFPRLLPVASRMLGQNMCQTVVQAVGVAEVYMQAHKGTAAVCTQFQAAASTSSRQAGATPQ